MKAKLSHFYISYKYNFYVFFHNMYERRFFMERKDFKLLLKEFLFVPILLFVLILLISKFNIFYKGKLLNCFCLLFSSTMFLVLLEMFLMFDVPKNLLFSRLVGVLVSCLCFFLTFTFLKNINLLILMILSIYLGQGLNYIFERFVYFKRSELISVLIIIIITFILTFFEFF